MRHKVRNPMKDELETTVKDAPAKDRKFVEALSRGLDVLRAFSQGSVVMGNQDIARITGLPKPTVSRMTYTLTKLGYLSYSPQLEKYQLDSGVLALGYAYVSNLRVRQLAKPYMDEFSRRTNTSVGLTCRDRLSMIYIENCRPAEVSTLRMDAGVRLPLATTAAGRAFLAAPPDKERGFFASWELRGVRIAAGHTSNDGRRKFRLLGQEVSEDGQAVLQFVNAGRSPKPNPYCFRRAGKCECVACHDPDANRPQSRDQFSPCPGCRDVEPGVEAAE